jgi:hypothetical protein
MSLEIGNSKATNTSLMSILLSQNYRRKKKLRFTFNIASCFGENNKKIIYDH